LHETVSLTVGDKVRCVREPYFGLWGTVEELPSELKVMESESPMEVAVVRLDGSGETVVIPEANLEVFREQA